MGWSAEDHWPRADRLRQRRIGSHLGMSPGQESGRRWPTTRSAEAAVKLQALREHIGYRGPVDQDGHAVSDGTLPDLVTQWRQDLAAEDSGG